MFTQFSIYPDSDATPTEESLTTMSGNLQAFFRSAMPVLALKKKKAFWYSHVQSPNQEPAC
jgi:hypothetical protein